MPCFLNAQCIQQPGFQENGGVNLRMAGSQSQQSATAKYRGGRGHSILQGVAEVPDDVKPPAPGRGPPGAEGRN